MPSINIRCLVVLLKEHADELYEIWSLSRNVELTDRLSRQHTRVLRIIDSLHAADGDDAESSSCTSASSEEDAALFLEEDDT